jgi:hypothetical protein
MSVTNAGDDRGCRHSANAWDRTQQPHPRIFLCHQMNVQHLASPDALKMTTGWRVARADGAHDVAMNVPGDVHSSLLRAGVITDP